MWWRFRWASQSVALGTGPLGSEQYLIMQVLGCMFFVVFDWARSFFVNCETVFNYHEYIQRFSGLLDGKVKCVR